MSILTASKFQQIILAASILLAPLLLSIWFSLCPQYGNPQCPTSADPLAALAAFKAADPGLMSIFLTVNTLIPYVYPLSYLGLGILAMKRSPWLASIGVILGWIGSIAWGVIAGAIFTGYDASRLLSGPLGASLLSAEYAHWQVYYIVGAGWVIGHQLAYVLLGLASWRAKVIPKWAGILLIVSAPIMGPIAYGIGNGWIQVAGFGLVLIASIPAAIKMLRLKTSLS